MNYKNFKEYQESGNYMNTLNFQNGTWYHSDEYLKNSTWGYYFNGKMQTRLIAYENSTPPRYYLAGNQITPDEFNTQLNLLSIGKYE